MSNLTKVIVFILSILIVFLGGFYTGKGQVESTTITKTIKGDEVIKTVDHIVTIIKTVKPDGTIIEERKNEDKQIQEHITYVDREKLVYTKPVLSNYSLGVMVTKSLSINSLINFKPDYSITAGYRAIGEFWLDTAYTPSTDTISLGISFKF